MVDRGKFFAAIRDAKMFGSTLDQSEVDGLNAILDAMDGTPLADTAYALGTAYKETAHTMQPIHEIGGDAYFFRRYDRRGINPRVAAELGNTQDGDGARFHGRGYVQLTGRKNYLRAGTALGVDLIGAPDLALRPDIAAKVMRQGMTHGWFTGRTFRYALPATGPASFDDFRVSRSIINGHDCESEIAGYAVTFQGALA